MKFFRAILLAIGWIARCVGTVALWTLWLALFVLLGVQAYIAASRELSVPGWMIRSLETQLADYGFRAKIGHTLFDPSGRILIQDMELSTPTFEDPLITLQSVYVRLDPWELLAGQFVPAEVRASGVDLLIPSMVSPTGKGEAVVHDLDFTIAPVRDGYTIRQFNGWLANVAVAAHGGIQTPNTKMQETRPAAEFVGTFVRAYLRAVRQAADLEPWLAQFDSPQIDLALEPQPSILAIATVRLLAPSARMEPARSHLDFPIELEAVRAGAVLPLAGDQPFATRLVAQIGRANAAGRADVHGLSLMLPGRFTPNKFWFMPGELSIAAPQVSAAGMQADDLSARVVISSLPQVSGQLSARFAGDVWSLGAEADLDSGHADVRARGTMSPLFFGQLSRRIGYDLNALLAFAKPPQIDVSAHLGNGWKLSRAEGRLATGPVVAHRVAIDGADAHFSLTGSDLNVTDIVLRQGQNQAYGIYRMDTTTNDYRILLTGRLRPIGIAGWFGEWWPHFWSHFDFSAAPPDADVDVQGRWGVPETSTVFVSADCREPAIQTVKLDRVRTTLFIRPEYYEALDFTVERGTGVARGTFARSVDLEADALRWMNFKVESTLDLAESARIFGKEGTDIVEPFEFGQPPTLQLSGRFEGAASGRGEHERVEIGVRSTGKFEFYGFPLDDIAFTGTWQDNDLDLREISAGFAGGRLHGHALLNGKEPERRLGFTVALEEASLGEAIHTLELFSAKQKGLPMPKLSAFQQRLAKGRFGLRASADGLYRDSLSYVGSGSAEVEGAELAEINLLGALSQALRRSNILNFTSLRLTSARANFNIKHEKIGVTDLKITGPSAAIDMKGTYRLDVKQMEFNAKVRPFDEGKTLLANAVGLVLTPLSSVLELKLVGTLDKPDWRFAYGPTSLLRTIAGKEDLPSANVAPADDKNAPPPLLRR